MRNSLITALGVPVFIVIAGLLFYFIMSQVGADVNRALSFIVLTSSIWLPYALFYLTFERWMWYVRAKYVYETGRSTLRIRLPQEVLKSPEAMENVLTQIFVPMSPTNLMEAYQEGRHPLVTSLELVGDGKEVKFYINCPTKKIKNIVEAQLYAQYPGVEVTEEPVDYAAEIVWNPDKYDLMAFHFCKKNDAEQPLRTYVDLGLDKMPKEEEKTDPMAPIIEHLSQVKPHERMWIQILLVPEAKTGLKTGDLHSTEQFAEKAQKKVDMIMQRNGQSSKDPNEPDEMPRLTPGERGLIEAVERNSGKYAYNVAIRTMYIVDEENGPFRGDMIGGMIKSLSQHDVINRNQIGIRWRTDFDYKFISDPRGVRRTAYKKAELEDYKKRYYMVRDLPGKADDMKLMSVEEIATIFHLPGQVLVSPGLTRIESQKREAPANLPIGLPAQ